MNADGELGALLDRLSRDTLMAHIREFDRWTKHAGTPGELESLAYVEREMKAYGFRTELILHDAYISLPGAARVEVDGRAPECITHSFSRPSGPGGVRAPIVYVGAGRAANYEGIDARGRIVLVEGVANPSASLEASRRGAVGQIHISPHEYLHEMCISPVWGSPDDTTVERLPSTVVVTVSLADGEWFKRRLAERPLEAWLFAEVDTGWRKTPILVADLIRPGAPADDPFVFFTGHHDTWHYGVMDNGGANATMLEVARLCASHAASWRRSLRVAFWSGHSQGRYSSSSWYADTHWDELERRALVHVNVDSTGGKGNTVVCDTTAAAELADLAREALQARAGQEFSGGRMHRAGDQSFWGIGVPAIFGNMSEQPAVPGATNAMASIFGGTGRAGAGTGWWWHNPADTADKIDADILARDTAIYLHVVWRLLRDPVLPIDFSAAAGEIAETVAEHQRRLAGRFDLGTVVDRARELQEKTRRFTREVRDGARDEDSICRANEVLVRLGRAIVPIAYTEGDRFRHDPALFQPPVPALADLARLADLEPDSDPWRFLAPRMRRECNRVADALGQACRIADEYLEGG